MPEGGKGWTSKDILTWIILIWGFSRLTSAQAASGPTLTGLECQYPNMTQSGLRVPLWAQGLGQDFTIEGEQ